MKEEKKKHTQKIIMRGAKKLRREIKKNHQQKELGGIQLAMFCCVEYVMNAENNEDGR